VDAAEAAPGSPGGGRLLCVAALVPHKGQDVLLDALAPLTDRRWRCALVGSLTVDPAFAGRLQRQAATRGLGDRVRCTGALVGEALRREYSAADVLVLPSRTEAYGMVVTEALAAGLPVIATAVGGIPEALGSTPAGPPGLLVRPGDPRSLGGAVADWLDDAALRRRLRAAAAARRETLTGWDGTVARIATVLRAVAGEPAGAAVRVPLRPGRLGPGGTAPQRLAATIGTSEDGDTDG
jgi:glycosyltransferase involved in cell wall biosynthesis